MHFIYLQENTGDLFIEYGGPIELGCGTLDNSASYTIEIDEAVSFCGVLDAGDNLPKNNLGLPLTDCISTPSNAPIIETGAFSSDLDATAIMTGSLYVKSSPVHDKFKWKLTDPYSIASMRIGLKMTMTLGGVATEFISSQTWNIFVRCRHETSALSPSTVIEIPPASEFDYVQTVAAITPSDQSSKIYFTYKDFTNTQVNN